MDYELAKQLKDARFPYSSNWKQDLGGNMVIGEYECVHEVPTLSELIEACGGGFGNLRRGYEGDKALNCDIETWETGRDKVLWQCNAEFEEGRLGGWSWDSEGETPEEAVAKLWLNLKQTSKE